ncbi:phosphoesterase PA-phosphatase [Quadrisphaera sp. INWT6]|uniref:phosphoesterase PA-phosphatase n=1 Tax=Quadrisphaera sp. INWT6 TaxID=2596917 RepID=UPI0018923AEF|nr:phosphoesterase PA-phosphatase [Quadrisphaera sp. INWT6]MBF5083092.1 phosphoesterase PA-phosphatase [Quadrisphaera sp. INWT6]
MTEQVDVEAKTSDGEGGGLRLRLARVFTELLAPSVVGVVCPVAVGALSDSNAWRGAVLGLLGAVFAIGLPYAYIAYLIRTGGATDRHVSRREDRPKVLIAVLLCLAVGISVLVFLGAPPLLVWLLVGEVLLVLACLVISKFWKISMHSAVAAGTVAALVVVLGPWALLAGLAVVLVSWGRIVLRDHTPAQVTVGAGLGAAVLSLLGFVS